LIIKPVNIGIQGDYIKTLGKLPPGTNLYYFTGSLHAKKVRGK
jgi:hypothetical protein